MKISCLRRAIAALPKIVLDQKPAIALNRFLSDEDVDWSSEANYFILFVDDCAADWNTVHLVAVVPGALSIWPYEPDVWVAASARMDQLDLGDMAHPEFFASNGEEFIMHGHPIWFQLSRVTGRDAEGWTESEDYPIEMRWPGVYKHFEFTAMNLQYIEVLETLLGIETVYAHA